MNDVNVAPETELIARRQRTIIDRARDMVREMEADLVEELIRCPETDSYYWEFEGYPGEVVGLVVNAWKAAGWKVAYNHAERKITISVLAPITSVCPEFSGNATAISAVKPL